MRRFLSCISLMVGLSIVSLGNSQTTPQYGGTLRFGLLSEPASLDPQVYAGDQTMIVKQLVYSTLVRFGQEGGEFVGDLADSWIVADPQTYTFHLRENARFHDGTPVTAADVQYSFARILAPDSTATRHLDLQVISEVVVDGDYNVTLRLKEPSAGLLGFLARPESAIISQRFVEGGGDLATSMLGSGPFKFDHYEPGIELKLVRFDDYYLAGVPYLDSVDFIPIADDTARVNALLSGQVDVTHFIPWEAMGQIDQRSDINLLLHTDAVLFLQYNVAREPFDDARVRRAVGYAINRDAVIRAAFLGRGTSVSGGAIPAEHYAFNADLEGTYTYDPGKARELLEGAGAVGAKITIDTYSLAFAVRTAEVIQNNLQQVGLDVDINVAEWPAFQAKTTQEGNFQARVYAAGWRVPDLDFYTPFVGTGSEFSTPGNFSDPELDALLATGRATVDPAQRKEIYHQVEARVLDLSPMTFISWRVNAWAASSAVEGLQLVPDPMGPLSGLNLAWTWLKR